MEKKFYCFSWKICFLLLTILVLTPQIIFSQSWVRKIDGFSMWSIGQDYAGNIYAGTTGSNRGIFKSTDGGETWINMFSTGVSNYLEIACDSLNNVYVANISNGVIYSTDGGQNFTTIPSSTFGGSNVNTVVCGKNGHIFVGVTNGGVWRSTDFGATFTHTNLQTNTIVSIAVDKFDAERIYAGSSSASANGFFISTDGGLTFGVSTNPLNVWQILQTNSNDLYIATTSSPYPFDKSTDGGLTWTTMGNQPGAMRGATLDLESDIYISGNGGVFKSTNGGSTFTNQNITFSSNKILTYNNKIMVCATGTANGGVWIFTDSTIVPVELTNFSISVNNSDVKLNWTTATELNNSGFEIQRASADLGFETIGFVPGFGSTTESHKYSFIDGNVESGKYSYRVKQIDFDGSYKYSDIVEVEVDQPIQFKLEQNFPNPFNPSTIINYSVNVAGFVKIKVFDVLGSEVADLVNETKDAGYHLVSFNAANLPSGVYIYTLEANNFTTGKKMILMK